jgi:hypothetical protein
MTFIVRLTLDGTGTMSGVVERVLTGEKARFQSLDALRDLIAAMATAASPGASPTEHTPQD